ncbi:MAG TPA: R3H domain-containing nucleic acid-binding protein [Clostridia bacterium]|nr:R3H domain-containing nucleic acid-binding protein [Clostridia bacterium]
MNRNQLEQIEKEALNLIVDLGVEAAVEASFDEESGVINLQIESPQPAILIGFHGETLHALQLIFSFLVHQILGEWFKVWVNVGDYRQKREEQLKKLALNLAMKAKFSGETQTVTGLSAAERRIIHLTLAEHPDVFSESEGEGRQRIITIKPKNS